MGEKRGEQLKKSATVFNDEQRKLNKAEGNMCLKVVVSGPGNGEDEAWEGKRI